MRIALHDRVNEDLHVRPQLALFVKHPEAYAGKSRVEARQQVGKCGRLLRASDRDVRLAVAIGSQRGRYCDVKYQALDSAREEPLHGLDGVDVRQVRRKAFPVASLVAASPEFS